MKYLEVKFFDPHPGLLGYTIPLPESVRLYAESMDGVETTIDRVIEDIRELCPDATEIKSCPHDRYDGADGFIALGMGEVHVKTKNKSWICPRYNWRVIRWKDENS